MSTDASANIHVLPTRAREVSRSLIDLCEDLLAMAKSGELVAAACAVIYADGSTGSFASQNDQAAKQIGAVAILAHELVSNASNNGSLIAERPKPPPNDPA